MSAQAILEQQKELAYVAVRRLQALTGPLNKGLKQLYPRTEIDSATDEMTRNIVQSYGGFGQQPVVFRWQRCTLVAPFDRLPGPSLRMSRSLELFGDGRLELHLMVHVGPEGVMGSFFTWQSEGASALVGSVEAEKMLEDGVGQLSEVLKRAVDIFVEHLPALDDSG